MMLQRELSERGKELLRDFPVLATLREHDRRGIDSVIKMVEDAAEYNRLYSEPIALDLDERMEAEPEYFERDILEKVCKYRFLSMAVPSALGGLADKYMVTAMALTCEELSSCCAGIGLAIAAHSLGVSPLLTSGAMAHWETVLYEIVEEEKKGKPVVMAYAITEPSAGTDVEEPEFLKMADIGMEARKVEGGYLLNGRKCFISGGSEAKYITVCAATDRTRPMETWSTFLVDKDMEGFSCPRVELKMGQRACHAAELLFEDVFVPDSHILGYEGDGIANGMLIVLAASRGPVGAIATGIARGAYEHFLAWARTPRNGKRPIDEERIQMALVDMKAAVQQSRGMYLSHSMAGDAIFRGSFTSPLFKSMFLIPRAIRASKPMSDLFNSDYGKAMVNTIFRFFIKDEEITDLMALGSLAKFSCADHAMEVTSRALELMGADDSIERRWVEKCYRDAKLTQIYEGTNQLNRLAFYDARIGKTLKIEVPGPFKRGV
jgi:acyl-CoA dehydrogenase